MNHSQRQRRAAVLQSQLADWQEAYLVLRCPRCRVERVLRVLDLCRAYGGEHRLAAVVNRLRCATPQCGSPPCYVRIEASRNPRSAAPVSSILLVGAGAYD